MIPTSPQAPNGGAWQPRDNPCACTAVLDLLQLSDDPDVFAAYDPSQNSYCDVDLDREPPAVVCNGGLENWHVAAVVAGIQDEFGYEVFANNTAPLPANATSDGSVNVITGLYVAGMGIDGPLKGIAELSALIEMDISSNWISSLEVSTGRRPCPGVRVSVCMRPRREGPRTD